MHDFNTRAGDSRHQRRSDLATALVAVLSVLAIGVPAGKAVALGAQSGTTELSGTAPSLPDVAAEATASHDLAIEIVQPGQEGLALTARLTDDGGMIQRALHWTIVGAAGETLFDGDTPEAAVRAQPGDYAVTIRYGAVRLDSTITLLEGNHLSVSYVLNAGAMRILPRLEKIGLPGAIPESRIFALAGRQRGKMVALSTQPGEVIRIPEGRYRVDSAFAGGNTTASTEVTVMAGRVSAVEIDHKAGLARLSFVGAPDTTVEWHVVDAKGAAILATEGLSANAVLLPGTYTASARIGNETLSATFGIVAGETRDIILGN